MSLDDTTKPQFLIAHKQWQRHDRWPQLWCRNYHSDIDFEVWGEVL